MSDPIVADDATIFSVGTACASDINGDGMTNSADLSVLLNKFGQSDVCGIAGDFNGDNEVNAFDLSVMLSQFDTSCGSAPFGEDLGLLDDLGFASIEAYETYLQGLSPTQLEAHIALLLELVNQ